MNLGSNCIEDAAYLLLEGKALTTDAKQELAQFAGRLDAHHLEPFLQHVNATWKNVWPTIPAFVRSTEAELKKR